MKIKILSAFMLLILVSACKKEENSEKSASENETSMVQKPRVLKSMEGDSISVTYFAEGDKVAVKISRNGAAEQKLSAKGTRESGEPFFSNGVFTWEMMEDGHSGKLIDGKGNSVLYK